MIFVTRSSSGRLYINPELIQTVEATPDTVITLVSGRKLIVKETPEEVCERFIEYRQKSNAPYFLKNGDRDSEKRMEE